jgi:hypothetical protein
MKKFLVRHHRKFAVLSLLCFVFVLAGCGLATWIATANQIVPIAGSMAAGVLALIAALSGKTLDPNEVTTLTTVVGAIQKALNDISAMVTEYQATPSTTLLGDIEAATKAVIDNINQFLQDTGITDTATQAKVSAILNLVLNEVTSFASLLPILSATAGEKLTLVVPMPSKDFKKAYNELLTTPTGNTAVDAALAEMKRL